MTALPASMNEQAHVVTESLRRDGFSRVEQIVTGADLERLRRICDSWLSGELTSTADHWVGGTLHQIFQPSRLEPFLADNRAIDNAKEVTADILGDSFFLFDSMICKPAGDPHEVPWHQDAAYQEAPFAPAGSVTPMTTLQLWIPLDDVDEENGCMHYLPGLSNEPLLPHRVVGGEPDDPRRLLGFAESVQIDESAVVPVRLKAGDAVIHNLMSPHWTPPNVSVDRNRRVYTFLLCAETARADFTKITDEYTV